MTALELRFLGDFDVRRDGRSQALPPSRKTRALLAYLALQPRRFSREQLCQLLWEVPDDPRGSLRWSLSKLRALLDDEQHARIAADRLTVGIVLRGATIDVLELRALVADGLPQRSTEELESAAARFRGNMLEGLDFCGFHDFHAWCAAQREHALRDRVALLQALTHRLAGAPERALPHARALVGLSPYDESLRAALIRLLNAARQFAEAEEQYQLGLRMLKEAGIAASGELLAARRPLRIDTLPLRSKPAPICPASEAAPAASGLVGRAAEAAQINRSIDEAVRQPACAVLLLRGAPGIGKSRLLATAQAGAQAHGAQVLHAAAFEPEAIRPFGLWIDALRAPDGAAHNALFGQADPTDREHLFARLSDFVGEQVARQPLVLLFDDVQWCDESSAAALHFVARSHRARALLLVLAAREGELRDNAPMQQALRGLRRDGLLREIELGPLGAPDLARIIEEQAPGADSQQLSQECGGNPLLAIELARAVVHGGAAGPLSELVRERLSRCSAVTVDVLRWASMLGPRIGLASLSRLSALDAQDVAAALELGQRQALLQSGGRGLDFAHALIARAVYDDISPWRRQVMHRRVAELLEQDTAQDLARAADLAHHAALSGDAALAARAMVRAGRLCLRFFANEDAQSLARKGLQLAEGLAERERICLEIDLHNVLLAARPLQDKEGAARHFIALAERALDHGEGEHARLGYHMAAWIRWTQGQSSAALEQQLQAMRAVRGGAGDEQIVGMAEAAKCLVLIERDIAQADAMLMEAAALAQRRGFAHQALSAGLGMLRLHEGRLDEAEGLLHEARLLCKAAGDRVNEFQANEYLVMLDMQRGRLLQARAGCDELLALGDKLRGGSEEPFGRAMAGLCAFAIDDRAEGMDQALHDLRIADAKHRLAYVLTHAALLEWERGRIDAAGARADEALGYAQLLERPTESLLSSAVLSLRARLRGEHAAAVDRLHEVQRLSSPGAAAWAARLVHKLNGAPAHANEKETR